MLIHREQNWSRVWCSWNGIRTVATRSRVLFERSFAVPCCYCTDSFETISLTCEASGFPHSLFELLQDFVGIDEQIWSLGTAEIRDPGSLQPALKHLTPLLTSSLTEIPAQWSRDTFSNCFTWSLRFFHMSGSPREREIYIYIIYTCTYKDRAFKHHEHFVHLHALTFPSVGALLFTIETSGHYQIQK